MSTVILALVFILIFLGMYVLSGGWKKYKGFRGITEWLKRGGMSGNVLATRNSPTVSHEALVQISNEMKTVLEDVYREFRQEADQIRRDTVVIVEERVADVEKALAELREELERSHYTERSAICSGSFETDVPEVNDISHQIPEASEQVELRIDNEFNPLYFQILDQLHVGVAPTDIAKSLSVDMKEIELVKQLMDFPGESDGAQFTN